MQRVAKFREMACFMLTQRHFPAQLPALELMRDAKVQQCQQRRRQRQQQQQAQQHAQVATTAAADSETAAAAAVEHQQPQPPETQRVALDPEPQQQQQQCNRHNATMDTLAGVATAILDAHGVSNHEE